MNFLVAFSLGLVGSLHCIGMCGPLALAIPSKAGTRWKFILERIVINLGKACTYAIMGAALGLIGKNLLMGVQQNISILLGAFILFSFAIPFSFKSKLQKYSPLEFVYTFVKLKFSLFLTKRGMFALFILGMLNGLLPCGLVYTALLGATAVADLWQSALFMLMFGVGTAPALITVSLAGKLLSIKFRSLFSKAIPVFSIVLAVILILRGMNLGIPLLSPKTTHSIQQNVVQPKMDCCQ